MYEEKEKGKKIKRGKKKEKKKVLNKIFFFYPFYKFIYMYFSL